MYVKKTDEHFGLQGQLESRNNGFDPRVKISVRVSVEIQPFCAIKWSARRRIRRPPSQNPVIASFLDGVGTSHRQG
jgi:hypothetical protein